MKAVLLAGLALLSAAHPELVDARAEGAVPGGRASTSSGRTGQEARETPDQVARRYGLAGEVLVAKGGTILLDSGYGPIAPTGGAAHRAGERWRLASITKQVTAALLLRRWSTGLDSPMEFASLLDVRQVPEGPPSTAILTIRQLLTHHSGLISPEDSVTERDGVPSFYKHRFSYEASGPDLGFCLSKPAKPGSSFRYNNCDYALLGAWMEKDRAPRPIDWPVGLAMARPDEVGVPGFVAGKPEPVFHLARWGAVGGLIGTARAVFAFDRSLMTGQLLSPAALAELWKPEGHGSYQALGQWVFPGQLGGCAAPKRIVQRDGEIGGVQARNYILPDDDLAVIVFTNRSSDDFPIGEVWQGKGFAYDLLSAAACAKDSA